MSQRQQTYLNSRIFQGVPIHHPLWIQKRHPLEDAGVYNYIYCICIYKRIYAFNTYLSTNGSLEVYPEFSNISRINGLQEQMNQFTQMFLPFVRLAGLNVFFDTHFGNYLQ